MAPLHVYKFLRRQILMRYARVPSWATISLRVFTRNTFAPNLTLPALGLEQGWLAAAWAPRHRPVSYYAPLFQARRGAKYHFLFSLLVRALDLRLIQMFSQCRLATTNSLRIAFFHFPFLGAHPQACRLFAGTDRSHPNASCKLHRVSRLINNNQL